MKILITALVLAACPFMPRPVWADNADNVASNDVSHLKEAGWQLWQDRKLPQAIDKFQQAVQLSPGDADAWNGLGWAQLNSGQSALAKTAFQKAVSIQSDHPAALNGLGQVCLSERNYGDAETYLLKAAPKAPAAWFGLARLYLLQGKFEQAEKWAQDIVDSGQADATASKMLEAAKANKLSDGLRLVIEPPATTSQTAPSGNDSQLTQEGWQLWQQRKLTAAAAKFQEAVEAAPGDADAWNGLGWAQFNSGHNTAAEAAFQKAVSIQPDHPAALNGLGQIYLSEQKYDDAEKYLLRASPKAPAAWYGLARLYLLQGKFNDAEKWAQDLVDSGQADATAQKMLEAAKAGKLPDGLRMLIEPSKPKPQTP